MERPFKNYPEVLSANMVAEILGIAPRTARNLIKNGTINGLKIGGLYKVPKGNLISYLYRNNKEDSL